MAFVISWDTYLIPLSHPSGERNPEDADSELLQLLPNLQTGSSPAGGDLVGENGVGLAHGGQ